MRTGIEKETMMKNYRTESSKPQAQRHHFRFDMNQFFKVRESFYGTEGTAGRNETSVLRG